MNEKTQDLLDRTLKFGVEILKFLAVLPYDSIYKIPKVQLARAATSIGANYEEAQAGESKKDFGHKVGIVCKETRESIYWIRVLKMIYTEEKYQAQWTSFLQEATEFKKIFTSIKLSVLNNK